MKRSIFSLLFLAYFLTAFAEPDSLYNAATIGQATRNQKAGKGLQVGAVGSADTLQANGYGMFNKSVAIGGAQDNSALLNLTSVAKGLGLPGMTTAQMLGISSPKNGLIVFNTDSGKIYYAVSSSWFQLGGGGATGPTGATGNTGATGATGAAGSNGSNGSNGATGATGATGVFSGEARGTTGNSGTNPATNYIGTTDGQPFKLKSDSSITAITGSNFFKVANTGFNSFGNLMSGKDTIGGSFNGFRHLIKTGVHFSHIVYCKVVKCSIKISTQNKTFD